MMCLVRCFQSKLQEQQQLTTLTDTTGNTYLGNADVNLRNRIRFQGNVISTQRYYFFMLLSAGCHGGL